MNKTITFKVEGIYYCPADKESEYLMQHCLNEHYVAISDISLPKLKIVAAAHGWKVVII